jgi:methylglutaconyl-CoA hydratase
VTINRPERRNAFNEEVVAELAGAFERLPRSEARVVVLTGADPAFSAGADLEYMRSIKEQGREANVEDALALADLLETIATSPLPVVAKVNGPAIGGGVGLVAACDIAIARQGAFFAFSEVRLGLVPAVIGPWVVRAIGERAARYWMLTGERFHAEAALEMGLVHQVAVTADLDAAVQRVVESLLAGGPAALDAAKRLALRCGEETVAEVKGWTAELIADLRASEEGQEGMASFLEKRRPDWSQGRQGS